MQVRSNINFTARMSDNVSIGPDGIVRVSEKPYLKPGGKDIVMLRNPDTGRFQRYQFLSGIGATKGQATITVRAGNSPTRLKEINMGDLFFSRQGWANRLKRLKQLVKR